MSDDVKGRRRYESPRRAAQAAQTKQDILAAARQLFLRDGYAGATVAAIAQAAGVVVETVYRSYGGKAALFKAVVEAAVAGGVARAQVAVGDRPAIRAIIEEPDPYRKIDLYVATQPGIHARSGLLVRTLRAAAATEPELAEVWWQLEDQRRAGMASFGRALAESGALQSGLTAEQAGDILWTLASHDVHERLVIHCGWSPERFAEWLAATLKQTLLGDRG
jgi:AcrR family transcriptional regulator